MIKNICVYCSSSNMLDEKFYKLAEALGVKMAQDGYGLVYGGTNIGTMGVLANAVCDNGGNVIGVIPEKIQEKGFKHPDLANVIVTKDMRERKATMEKNADAFIALPGGFGTFEEVFEMIVAKQLDYHRKPIVFLNIDGYYDPLFQMFENVYKCGFAKESSRELYSVANTVDEALAFIKNYKEKEFVLKW